VSFGPFAIAQEDRSHRQEIRFHGFEIALDLL
jgi:hypothetical protein